MVAKIDYLIRGTSCSPYELSGNCLRDHFKPFLRFFFNYAIKSSLNGLKCKMKCIFWYFFSQGCIGPCIGPLSGGMSLKIDRKQLKKEFFLVKWLTLVYWEPVNSSLTIGSAKYFSPFD